MLGDLEIFAGDVGFIEGPVWDEDRGVLSIVSISHACIFSFDSQGGRLSRVQTGGGPNGMALGRDGLYVAQNGGIFGAPEKARPGIQLHSGDSVRYVLNEGLEAPNDLAFGPDGLLYVTDLKSERAILEPIPGQVFACDLVAGTVRAVATGRLCPNGLAFSADGRQLLVGLTQSRRVERFLLTADGLVSDGIFCELTNGRPDGMAFDEAGRLWICTPGTGGIELFSPGGAFLGRHEIGAGSMTTNLCFGGQDDRDLYVTAAGWGQVLRYRTDAPGLALRRGPALIAAMGKA